ncbi:hypothetical protein ACN082_08720 [Rothia sp. CCM 9417]|uniref:hypothetical protein n=1 Tax=unclassified Rothia (in: high G+C Gram-positive bacteria) TaxID=2689056 RepID=UPI003ACED495
MSDTKPANVQKRDTTFKQEHGAVAHLLKRKPEQAIARAVRGAQKLLDEAQNKQALNVLTLVKPILAKRPEAEQTEYWMMLATIHQAMGNPLAAQRAEENIRA